MRTDRELLEMAAKANWAGTDVSFWFDENEDGIVFVDADNQDHNGRDVELVWRPSHDDGDCARMEAQLLIDVVWHEDQVDVDARHTTLDNVIHFFKDYGGDKQAARRMASLRVAAEIGATMP